MLPLQEHRAPRRPSKTINQRSGADARGVRVKFGAEEQFDQDELVGQLAVMKESLREEYRVGKTLAEQLADAVAAEEYERAARLRDEIAKRRRAAFVAIALAKGGKPPLGLASRVDFWPVAGLFAGELALCPSLVVGCVPVALAFPSGMVRTCPVRSASPSSRPFWWHRASTVTW